MSSIRMKLLKGLLPKLTKNRHALELAQFRAAFASDAAHFCKLAKGTMTQALRLDACEAEWLWLPTSAPDRVILYLHGGAYVFGSIATHRNAASQLALAAKARVFMLAYRLAPEHPFPAALDDAMNAYRFLLESGVAASRLVLAGDSAGGGLAVATMLRARAEGLALPAAAVLLSPWFDLTLSGDSMIINERHDPLCKKAKMREWANMYLGPAGEPTHPYVSPLFAELSGLPPMLTYVSSDETLLDDALRFTDKATKSGVEASLVVGKKHLHVWPLFGGILPEARRSILEIARYIAEKTS